MEESAMLAQTQPVSPRPDIDTLADIFGPDTVLPEQIVSGYRNDSYLSGEKALMLAVLEDGIRCFQEHLRNRRLKPHLLSVQAEEWMRAEDWDWPFSFNNVCETLGLDPEALRGTLFTWKEKKVAGLRSHTVTVPAKVYRLHLRTKRSRGVRCDS